MDMKRLVIVGAGAVGGCVGGLLANAGFPIAFVARGEHGRRIREAGLQIQTSAKELQVQVPVFESVEQTDWQDGDVAMLAVKLQDARSLMDRLLERASANLPVVCASNGIHGEHWAMQRFQDVIGMLVWMPATHMLPGQVQLFSGDVPGVLDNGPVQGPSAQSLSRRLTEQLVAVGFDATSRDDIMRWNPGKWLTNLGNAAQALITDDWQSVAKQAQTEGEAILAAADVDRVSTADLLKRCSTVTMRPIADQQRQGGSTWQSLQRGKPMETPWIEGAMVELAHQSDADAEALTLLTELSEQRLKMPAEVFRQRLKDRQTVRQSNSTTESR